MLCEGRAAHLAQPSTEWTAYLFWLNPLAELWIVTIHVVWAPHVDSS